MKPPVSIPEHTANDEVSVKFSGGKDSTLTAYFMAKEFKRVHLVTFGHYLTSDLDNVLVNYHKLQDIFTREKILHTSIDIDDVYKYLFDKNYFSDLLRYRTFLTVWVGCGICKLAMHTRTIIYNLQHGIRYTCDGANITGFDPSQQRWLIEEVKKFYKEYDIEYFNPVYTLPRSDLELFRIGLLEKKPVLLTGKQSGCLGSNFHNIYLRLYYLPRYGREAYEKESLEYWREKIEVCKKYIEEQCG